MYTPKSSRNVSGVKDTTPIYTSGHAIGQVRNDTFYKAIAGNHYLRVPCRAIAFSLESLSQAERAGAVRVEVKDKDSGTIYRASIAHIRDRGFPVNRAGFEPQIALAMDGWTKQTKGAPLQPSLWGGAA